VQSNENTRATITKTHPRIAVASTIYPLLLKSPQPPTQYPLSEEDLVRSTFIHWNRLAVPSCVVTIRRAIVCATVPRRRAQLLMSSDQTKTLSGFEHTVATRPGSGVIHNQTLLPSFELVARLTTHDLVINANARSRSGAVRGAVVAGPGGEGEGLGSGTAKVVEAKVSTERRARARVRCVGGDGSGGDVGMRVEMMFGQVEVVV
jgi:hypothetical protein